MSLFAGLHSSGCSGFAGCTARDVSLCGLHGSGCSHGLCVFWHTAVGRSSAWSVTSLPASVASKPWSARCSSGARTTCMWSWWRTPVPGRSHSTCTSTWTVVTFSLCTCVMCYRVITAPAYTSAGPLSLKQNGVFTFFITSGCTEYTLRTLSTLVAELNCSSSHCH